MLKFKQLFSKPCSVIGMVHVLGLPGTPSYIGNTQHIIDRACHETEIYLKHGVDSILVENMHDLPYVQSQNFGPEITAMMTRVCSEIRKLVTPHIPLGIQILACGNREALAVAQASNFNYIRAEGFVFSHIADEGFTNANSGILLRYRKQIEANNVLILTDIKKKHSSHAITDDLSIVDIGKAAEFFLSDGLIITGKETGDVANLSELQQLRATTNLPIIIGSGVTRDNVKDYIKADAVIIGSHFKENGKWFNELSSERVKQFMERFYCLV